MNTQENVTRHFNNVAKTYRGNYEGDNIVAHSFSTRRRIVLGLLGNVTGKSILDIGCGPGVLAKPLAGAGCDFFGIDIAPEMIAVCKADDSLRSFSFEATDPVGFLERNPEMTFDAVTCMGLFEYLTDDYTAALMGAIRGALRPGGQLIATYPNYYSPYRTVDRVYRALTRKEVMVPPFTPGVKHKDYREGELTREWASHGLRVVEAVYYNFRVFPKPVDGWIEKSDLWTARRLQFLERSPLRFLGTGLVLGGRPA